MLLILSHQEAEILNRKAGEAMGVKSTSIYRWSDIVGDKLTALDVGDCDGLTESELSDCVDKLPNDFVKNWN